MAWYTVVKTINGGNYLYNQRTYRVGGKVKTESHYLGVLGGGQRARSSVANKEALSNTKPVAKKQQSKNSSASIWPNMRSSVVTPAINAVKEKKKRGRPRKKAAGSNNWEVSFRIHKRIKSRKDMSEVSLRKEHDSVELGMRKMGINSSKLKPVRVWPGRKVKRKKSFSAYFVIGPDGKSRNNFKKEIRRALAERWLDGLRDAKRAKYARLAWKLWKTSHLGWKAQAVSLLGEAIGSGYKKTLRKYTTKYDDEIQNVRKYWYAYRAVSALYQSGDEKKKRRKKCRSQIKKARTAETQKKQVSLLSELFE